MSHAGGTKAAADNRALGAFWRGAQSKQIVCKDTLLRIFKTMVLPVGLYGSGIWGMKHLSIAHTGSVFSSPTQDVQSRFLRLLLGAHDSISRWILHKNACLPPVQLLFFQSACRLWSSLKADPFFLIRVLRSDIALYKCGNNHAWAGHLIKQAHLLGEVR